MIYREQDNQTLLFPSKLLILLIWLHISIQLISGGFDEYLPIERPLKDKWAEYLYTIK